MLELKNVSLTLGKTQLFSSLSFLVRSGEILCISGQSECGKTVLLESVLGIHQLNSGYLSIDGFVFSNKSMKTLRSKMAYLPQNIHFKHSHIKNIIQEMFGLNAHAGIRFSKSRLLEDWQKIGLDASEELYNQPLNKIPITEQKLVFLTILAQLSKSIYLIDDITNHSITSEQSIKIAGYLRSLAENGSKIIIVSNDEVIRKHSDKILEISKQ